MEETKTTRPRPRAIMPGASSLVSCIGAVRLTATSSAIFSAVISPIGPAQPTPALLTRMSIPAVASPAPGGVGSVAAAASAAAASSAGPSVAARSPTRAMPPVWSAMARSRPGSRPAISSRAPAAASARAVAAPMPDDPPVTSATAPVSRMAPHYRAPAAPPQALTGRAAASLTGRAAASLTGRAAASLTGRAAASFTGRAAASPNRPPPARARSGPCRGGLTLLVGACLGPAAHDVTHGQQPGHVLALDHHEVAEPSPDHARRGLLQRPIGRCVHHVECPVRGGQLDVGVLPRGEGVEDVALGQDAHAGMFRVDDHGRAHAAG